MCRFEPLTHRLQKNRELFLRQFTRIGRRHLARSHPLINPYPPIVQSRCYAITRSADTRPAIPRYPACLPGNARRFARLNDRPQVQSPFGLAAQVAVIAMGLKEFANTLRRQVPCRSASASKKERSCPARSSNSTTRTTR
jgi:hypothetical protein